MKRKISLQMSYQAQTDEWYGLISTHVTFIQFSNHNRSVFWLNREQTHVRWNFHKVFALQNETCAHAFMMKWKEN